MSTQALYTSDTQEWYTPQEYIDRVRSVFNGQIDLDPASCAMANEVVKAETYWTAENKPLEHMWDAGTVFCNPPYGGMQGKFLSHMLAQHRAGRFIDGIFLCNASVGETWWASVWQATAVCLVYRRIRFDTVVRHHEVSHNDREKYWTKTGRDRDTPIRGIGPSPTKGNSFVYMGEHPNAFDGHFCDIGRIITR